MRIHTLIVEDMLLARKRIRRQLSADPEIEVVGECPDGLSAVTAIRALAPDLLFLDVQMPEMNAFQVLGEVGVEQVPAVIFVTAYDQFAIQAFDVHAVDYLLKPFSRERFQRAVERAKNQIRQRRTGDVDGRLRALLDDVGAPRYQKRLAVKSSGVTVILAADEIDFIEGAGNYLRLKAAGETHMIRDRLSQLEAKLDPEKFARIHRSTIVNVERIKKMSPLFNGDQMVILRDGTRLTMSRRYRDTLSALLQ
jgi:two-component system, LytTR family, response regulator